MIKKNIRARWLIRNFKDTKSYKCEPLRNAIVHSRQLCRAVIIELAGMRAKALTKILCNRSSLIGKWSETPDVTTHA